MNAVRYAWRYLRDRGLRATVRAVGRRYIYCSLDHVVLKSSRIDPSAVDGVGEIRFRLGGPSDLDGLREFDRSRGVTPRPPSGNGRVWRFLACHREKIVATRWYSEDLPPYSLISRVLTLKRGQLWAGDAFCVPEYRSRGIVRRLGLFAQAHLALHGYTEFVGAISGRNIPSLRMTFTTPRSSATSPTGDFCSMKLCESHTSCPGTFTTSAPRFPDPASPELGTERDRSHAAVADRPRELIVQSRKEASGLIGVAVRDTGVGLDPQGLARLFETFYTTKPDGLGMGLSICRSIIEAHGGRVWVTANVPRGSIFQFTVPVHTAGGA